MPIRSGLIVVMRLFAMLLILQVLAYIYVLAVIFGRGDSTLALPQIAMMSLLLIPTLLIFWCSDAIIDFLAPRSSELRPEGRSRAASCRRSPSARWAPSFSIWRSGRP